MQEKHVVIIDHVGRTILGKVVESSRSRSGRGLTLSLQNPVILHVQPKDGGQLEIQTFPLFFFEFIDKAERGTNVWHFNLSNIVESDVVLDERILTQYGRINTPPVEVPVPEPGTSPKIISISDL